MKKLIKVVGEKIENHHIMGNLSKKNIIIIVIIPGKMIAIQEKIIILIKKT